MSKYSKEDYLDQLLYTMEDGSSAKKSGKEKKDLTPEDRWEREIFGDSEFDKDSASDEEEFLREFEKELLQDELPDMTTDFEEQNFYNRKPELERDDSDTTNNEPVVDEDAEFEGELPDDTGRQKEEQPDQLDDAMGAFDQQVSSDGQEETDLSGMKDLDLMDMLSGDEEFLDLGQMLSDEEEGKQIAGEDSIGAFAQNQMDEQRQMASSTPEPVMTAGVPETEGRHKPQKSKTSVLSKISRLLFGEEQDDTVVLTDDNVDNVMALSEENQQILNELEEADRKAAGQGKKKDKKKDKKKKAPKPKKEKKEKKKKAPKPQKEKKPKPVDNTPPLPRGPVIAIVVLAASLLGLVLLGTSVLGYQANVNAAKEGYQQGTYLEAYQKMQGLKVKQKDEKLYNRLSTLAPVAEKYQAYLIFDHNGSKDMALDSLVCAYGRYEINQVYAKDYECEPEMETLKEKIISALKKDFSMTAKEASELYRIKDRNEYTIRLREKI